ncbi:hypothetical protein KUTeg_006704 [Tegillarca granosa]|uniref:RRM domain-containing protein n=1 Tax=Tegillarca granosa TaxID=220873 RepID=A0ABQ9FB35_TEGGR|nr:hypothetical protein KUTeg_006704 [Tegillarca granosa]
MESTGAHVRKSKTLFIRNLPFSTTNDKLEDAFSDIGPIKQCFVVKNKDSEKCKGYGYVTFSLFDDAEKAKEKIKSLDGRKLYISYADRKKDEKKKKKAKISNDTEDLAEESEVEEKTGMKLKAVQLNKETIVVPQKELKKARIIIRNLSFKCTDDLLEKTFRKFGNISEVKIPQKPDDDENDSSDEGFDDRNSSSDNSDDEDESDEEGDEGSDISDDEEDMNLYGTAFVQFMKKEDADKCLQEANDELQDGGIKLDGRKLSITVAVNRDTAIKFNEKKDKEKIDRRNLHLAREGIIRTGTQAAQGLSKDDLAKRMKCRIMRDQARVSGQGVAKSRGFGFINFTDHQDALQALRYTNNNPDLFGEKKRLIVEFSLENKAALVAKDKRMERIKARQESLKKNKNEEISKKDKRPSKKKKKQKETKDAFDDLVSNYKKKIMNAQTTHKKSKWFS